MVNALAVEPMPRANTPTPLDEALDALFALAECTLRARRCSLYLRLPAADEGEAADGVSLLLYRGTGLTGEAGAGAGAAQTEGTIVGLVARARVPLLVQDTAACPALPTHPDRYATASFVAVPILVENEAVGVLNAADRHDGQAFREDDLRGAELLARVRDGAAWRAADAPRARPV